ncbi:DUF724 domain-containing protein 3-like [Iris pallida]|uniref:DUF724 domain-containing protein 3-like n=1 Tax=Iris pallida TaxID=29817 RepID=A0AAX6EXE3_IRIPA|nr:DUF724 domain-containing protein 3-like [Iris pallida]
MLYSTGDEVEVRSDEDGFRGARFAARIVRSMPKLGRFTVEYETLTSDTDTTRKHRETVNGDHLRPRPPPPPPAAAPCRFGVGQRVDALQNEGWWDGVVQEVLGDGGRYRLMFTESKEEAEFAAEELRVHMEWVNREWVIPEPKNMLEAEFSIGSIVEVSSDDEEFLGAWFNATIIGATDKDFLVEYQSVGTDEETKLLTETVDLLHIRPTPPDVPEVKKFKLLEEVDAFHNDGWWVGVISKVLDGQRYMVYFRSWKEEMEFGRSDLRLHHDWIGGRWVRTSQISGSSRCGRSSRLSTTSFRPPTTPHTDDILLSEDGLFPRARPIPSSTRDTHTPTSTRDTSTPSLAPNTPIPSSVGDPSTPSSSPPFVSTVTGWASEYPNLHYDASGRYLPRLGDPPTPPERPIGEFRQELWPLNKELFFPSTATRALGALIRGNYHGPYINFSQVPDEKKFIWLQQMKKSYWWPEHRDYAIRKTYKGACSHKIRDAMDDLKKAIARGKGKKEWVLEEYWREMQARLETPEFKKRSEQAKKARSCAGLHTGGSIPTALHARNLADKIAKEGRNSSEVGFAEIFEHTHKRKDGTYVDEKASNTYAAFQSLRTEATSRAIHGEGDESVGQSTDAPVPTSLHTSIQDNDLWIKAVGGRGKGGHIYGTGSLATQVSVVSRPPPAYTSVLRPSDVVLAQVVSTVTRIQSNMERMQETIESMRSERTVPAISVADDAPAVLDTPASYVRHVGSVVPATPAASSIAADVFARFVSALPPGVVSSLPPDVVSSLPSEVVSLLPPDVVTHLQAPPPPPPPPPELQ